MRRHLLILILLALAASALAQDANWSDAAGTVNIARLATFHARPTTHFLGFLADGSTATGCSSSGADSFAGLTFWTSARFASPRLVTQVRFTAPPVVWTLKGDSTGNGTYDITLHSEAAGPVVSGTGVGAWQYGSWTGGDGNWLYGLVIEEPNQADGQALRDVRILVAAPDANDTADLAALDAPALDANSPSLSAGPSVAVAAPAASAQYGKGMYAEAWMWGQDPNLNGGTYSEANMVAHLQLMGCNGVWIMPPGVNGYTGNLLYPSAFVNESETVNYLASLTARMHESNIKVYVGFHINHSNLWTAKDPNYADGNTLLVEAMVEAARCGVDGVSVVLDESRLAGGTLPLWDRLIAQEAAARIAAYDPNYETITNLYEATWNQNWDVVGHESNITRLGTESYAAMASAYSHWTSARYAAEMVGANPRRQAILTTGSQTSSNGVTSPLSSQSIPPTMLIGGRLSAAFHGCAEFAQWRLYQYAFYQGYQAHTATAHAMLDTLAAWGGREANVPSDVLLLTSYQAAKDFYSTELATHPVQDANDNYRLGFHAPWVAAQALLRAGLPFRVRFAEWPAEVEANVARVVVVPFPWELAAETLTKLEEAAAGGTRIVLLAKAGIATAAGGTSYETLLASPNVTVVPDDLAYGLSAASEANVLAPILAGLGVDRPTYLNAYGHDVELARTNGTGANANRVFLLVTNWEANAVSADIGAKLPAGRYWAYVRSSDETTKRAAIGGRLSLSAAELAACRVTLSAGESRVYMIEPAPARFGVRQ